MRFAFFLFLFPSYSIFSQIDVSIHAGGGSSLIYNSATVNMNHLNYGSPIRSIPKRSFEAGITGRKYFERTYLETGLAYSYIQSLHKENTSAPNNSSIPGEIHIEKLRTIGYLALPIVLCRNYGSFSIGAGIQPQFTLHVNEDKKMWQGFSEGNYIDPPLSDRTIKTFDLGFVGQANLEATKRLSLNFKLYWGILNINNYNEKGVLYEFYKQESPVVDRRLKNRQFVITLQYKLFQKSAS